MGLSLLGSGMVSIVFGLATAVFFASSSLAASRSVRMIGPYAIVAWAMLVGMILIIPALIISGAPTHLHGITLLWWIVSGAGNVVGLLLASTAFKFGKVGVVAPILATEGALAATVSAILGESIAPIAAFILLVIVGGVVLAAIGPDPEPLKDERPLLAATFAACAALCFGISLYSIGHLSSEIPIAWNLLPARAIGVLALTIPLFFMRKLPMTRPALPLVILSGVAEVVGFTCYTIGAQHGVAVTAVLASQFAPIAAIMAYVLFKERLGKVQIAGVVIIVVSVIALTLV